MSRNDCQNGSAYVVTLIVLLVMTLLGLALSLITQTEMLIGSNERTVNRVFYAADTGVAVSTARALVGGGYNEQTVQVGEPSLLTGHSFTHQVAVTPFVPILWEPCNWCPVNEGQQQFYKVNHAVTVNATRLGWTGGGDPGEDAIPLARKSIATMIEFQPWWQPPTEAISDPSQLQKVRY